MLLHYGEEMRKQRAAFHALLQPRGKPIISQLMLSILTAFPFQLWARMKSRRSANRSASFITCWSTPLKRSCTRKYTRPLLFMRLRMGKILMMKASKSFSQYSTLLRGSSLIACQVLTSWTYSLRSISCQTFYRHGEMKLEENTSTK